MSINMNVDEMMKMVLQNQKNINNSQKIQKLQELVKEKKAKENKILTDAKKTRLSKEILFQNSQYDFERLNKKTLILDINIGIGTTFNESLIEPFKIDRLSDIYLDSFTTFNALNNKNDSTNGNNMSFILGLNEFNIHSRTNKNSIENKIIIPNEETESGNNSIKIHKSKKYNFICAVNPCQLTKIEGTITNCPHDNSNPGNAFTSNGRFILELLIITRD